MNEADALDFFDEVVGGEDGPHAATTERREFVLEAANGRETTMLLTPCDRKYVIDQLNKLPDELLEMFAEADDVEEAQEEADATDALTGLSGDAIEAFENICATGMEHPDLTQHHFDQLVLEIGLEVLFEMGSIIIEMSLEDDGKITGFREPE